MYRFEQAEATRKRLYAKQGRNAQFSSKKERDAFLKKDISDITSNVTKRHEIKNNLDAEVASLENELKATETEIQGLREKLDGRSENLNSLSEEVQAKKDAWDKLQDQRK